MASASICAFLLAAISLDGVTGRSLSANVSFDANNVRTGDPMAMTVEFSGDADFASLHPPRLSRAVDGRTWKIDDASAKTETWRDARRLKYRVRPLAEGLLEFPALEFSYMSSVSNAPCVVSTLPVPVRAKGASQVALAGADGTPDGMPRPDGLFVTLEGSPWGSAPSGDEAFAWRKACANPSAAAFAAFPFPEARLNEAACEIASGAWARALSIYSALEWRIGQTPAIERGTVAALALKTGNPAAELPMWRRALRPVLRFAWAGRLACLLGGIAALAALMVAARRFARSLACLAAALAAFQALAFDPFEEMERHTRMFEAEMRNMMQGMKQFTGPGGMSVSVNGEPVREVEIKASVRPARRDLGVGEPFDLILSIETPKSCTVENVRLLPSQTVGLFAAGSPSNLPDGVAADTNSVVRRIAVPVRYDAPFRGEVSFRVEGRYSMSLRSGGRRGFFSQSISSSFAVDAPPVAMEVKPLSADGMPADFSGAVGTSFRLVQRADRYLVSTNDVVTIDYALEYSGYVPPDAFPGATERTESRIAGRRYFVADGRKRTDDMAFSWFDAASREYRTAVARGMALQYAADDGGAGEETVVVGAAPEETGTARRVAMRFAPDAASPEVAVLAVPPGECARTEETGGWVRVDDGFHAGWIRREEL